MTDSGPVAALYGPLKSEAMFAHAEFQLWDELYATHPGRVEILNATAGGFFAMLSPILADHLMMRLARLTDPPATGRFRNLTLQNLIPDLESSSRPADAETYRDHLRRLQEACDAMRVQRNKRMAHLDFATAVEADAEPLPGVKVTDLRAALVILQEALNVYERNQGLPTVFYSDFIHQAGPRALLGSLKRAIAYRKHVTERRIDPRLDDLTLPQRAAEQRPAKPASGETSE